MQILLAICPGSPSSRGGAYGILVASPSRLTGGHQTPPAWRPGDRLTLRGNDWTVVHRTAYTDCEALHVEDARGARSRTFLLPFDRPRRLDNGRLSVLSARAWLHAFGRWLFDEHPCGGLRDVPSGIDILPYQLEPALAMLRDGHPRLLIADAVGMGKTIEAGLVLRQLFETRDGFRGLILVPAGLKAQWAEELASRFKAPVVAADAAWLRTMSRSLPGDVNPWSLPGIHLASFDFIKRPESLRPLEDVRWDLLIVDEAHAASLATDRRAAVDAVARRSLRVILLTATPPADAQQFAALCRIGAIASGAGIVKFQRAEGAARAGRRSVMLAARLSEEERRMHRMLERYTTLVWRDANRLGSAQGRLATVVLRKRALSSAVSLEISLRRRRDLLAGISAPSELQLVLPLNGADADEDSGEDLVADHVLASPGLRNPADEQRWLALLIAAAAAVPDRDAKAGVLVRLLRRIRQPAIVFTEYRDTLERLRLHLLASDLPCCVLHGGLPAADRRGVLAEFARGGTTLLATDAAAEGLNLQRTCRVIVHYELPWNPSRMLQRAGRVDRIGQQRRVHEIALVASDTAESLVLAPLVRRSAGWLSGGPAPMLERLTESRVAEAVFEGLRPDAPAQPAIDAPCVSLALESDAAAEARRLQIRRAVAGRMRASHRKPARADVPVTTLERSSLPPGIVLLFDVKIIREQLDVVARSVAAIHVAVALREWPRRPARMRERLTAMLPDLLAAASPALGNLGQGQIDAVRQRFVQAQTRLRLREREVASVHASAARQLVQAGLFERFTQRTLPQEISMDLLDAAGQHVAAGAGNELVHRADVRALLVVPPR